jgi:hypothetical protein
VSAALVTNGALLLELAVASLQGAKSIRRA